MHSITQVVIDLIGLAVVSGVLLTVLKKGNAGNVNALIMASGTSIAGVTKSLEGR
jgi:hypothetical protein